MLCSKTDALECLHCGKMKWLLSVQCFWICCEHNTFAAKTEVPALKRFLSVTFSLDVQLTRVANIKFSSKETI